MMDYETKKEIDKLKARVKELEAKLAVASMPAEVSELIADLEMVPETGEDNNVTLEQMDEFIKEMGYQTLVYPKMDSIIFTDLYKDYELFLQYDKSIRLTLCHELDPEIDRNVLYLIAETRDLGADVRFDWKKSLIEFSVSSVKLTRDSYRHSIRYFIDLLNGADERLGFCYADAHCIIKRQSRKVMS